jgi:hypothetical protein
MLDKIKEGGSGQQAVWRRNEINTVRFKDTSWFYYTVRTALRSGCTQLINGDIVFFFDLIYPNIAAVLQALAVRALVMLEVGWKMQPTTLGVVVSPRWTPIRYLRDSIRS